MMKTYISTDGDRINQILNPKDGRFQTIVHSVDLSLFHEVEISEELLSDYIAGTPYDYIGGQVVKHVPTPEEIEAENAALLAEAKAEKIAEIRAYDSSPAVNEFTLGGVPLWLSREERASLKIRFEAEKSAGKTETVLWYNGYRFPIDNIDNGLGMLIMLELYASASYDCTQQHEAAVGLLDSVAAVKAYDFTTGYPEKVVL